MMPRDVPTRWNSTFDMLAFASDYKKRLLKLLSNVNSSAIQYQLTNEEWAHVEELRTALQVRRDMFRLS